MYGLTPVQEFFGVTLSNILGVVGALCLWAGFFFLSIIAQRYERVLARPTGYRFMRLAPTGIFGFALIQGYSALLRGMVKPPTGWAWVAYLLLFASGTLSLISTASFFRVVRLK